MRTERAEVGTRSGASERSRGDRTSVAGHPRLFVDGRPGPVPRGSVPARAGVCSAGEWSAVRRHREVPGVRRSPAGADRLCAARARRGPARSRADRILVGVAVALGAAVVVVVLGLVADLAAASHAAVPARVAVER